MDFGFFQRLRSLLCCVDVQLLPCRVGSGKLCCGIRQLYFSGFTLYWKELFSAPFDALIEAGSTKGKDAKFDTEFEGYFLLCGRYYVHPQ